MRTFNAALLYSATALVFTSFAGTCLGFAGTCLGFAGTSTKHYTGMVYAAVWY